MASEGAPPPPYNTSYQPNAPPQYPPYPNQPPYPPSAPPSYSATQDQPKAYPVQPGAAPYPQQGIPPGYGQPGYPIQGAAAGYTTQAVGVAYHPHAQTTIITQVLSALRSLKIDRDTRTVPGKYRQNFVRAFLETLLHFYEQ
ncbi:Hypothetical predicted protein [Paramuricea clavata]|uniref:Uncharacterized protein n=1 Tax=Paramuricea clavata TaxID=317549 RepID=A0A7D9LUD8_PARCT|nr:Hypothetical predicted protein [Paramuricea clavata]